MEMVVYMMGVFVYTRFLFEQGTWLVYWFLLFLLFWSAIAWQVRKRKIDTGKLTLIMNFVSIVLVMLVGFSWIKSIVRDLGEINVSRAQFEEEWNQKVTADEYLKKKDSQSMPTIYYIILDGYARQDVLQEKYQFDNTPFIDFLEQKGFYVAEQATSNYKSTALSLSSSLNYMYLNEVARQLGEGSSDENVFKTLIDQNRVFAQFRALGYQIVTFTTGYDFTDLSSADVVLSYGVTPDNFQNTVIGNTPLSIFLLGNQYDWHRQHIQFTLQHLPDITGYSQPTFVFAHVVAPHPPFVLDANGQAVHPNRVYTINDADDFMAIGTPQEYAKGYTDQLEYVNSRMNIIIQKILDESKTPPIIIIQSDHGPGMGLDHRVMELSDLHERMSILNAYYLPGGKTDHLYTGITPVNTFRVIFNEYFGANFPLLEDRNYYSSLFNLFRFVDITDKVQ
jgi:hypothetical protein